MVGIDVEALSPRDANARRPPTTAADLKTKAAAQLKASKDSKSQHPPPPPLHVNEPPSADRRDGAVYQVGKLLGKGGFAICYQASLVGARPKQLVALKMVKSKMPAKMEQKFQTELQIHSKMTHPHIVQFHRAFTFEATTYLVLENCPNGSLMDMVKRRKGLTEPEVRFYAVQIAGAIKYMHAKGVIHRDLKMGNIFLDRDMNAKIGDFGLAALVVTGRDMQTIRRTTLCGTPNYLAPEILEKGKHGHDHMVDIWSLGIILFAMLTSKPPFQSSTTDEIYRRARDRDYEWPAAAARDGKHISDDAKHVVASMLMEAHMRPMPDDIVQHPFFTAGGFVPSADDMTVRLRELPPDRDVFYPRAADTTTTTASGAARHAREQKQNLAALQALCAACQVGPWAPVATVCKPVWREMAAEEKAHLTPVIPLAEGLVYRPYAQWVKENKGKLMLDPSMRYTAPLKPPAEEASVASLTESMAATTLSMQSTQTLHTTTEPSSSTVHLPPAQAQPPLAEWSTRTAAAVASAMEVAQRGAATAAVAAGTGNTLRAAPPQSFAASQRAQNRPAAATGATTATAAATTTAAAAFTTTTTTTVTTTTTARRPLSSFARSAARRDIPLGGSGLSLQAREQKAAEARAPAATATVTRSNSRTQLPTSLSAGTTRAAGAAGAAGERRAARSATTTSASAPALTPDETAATTATTTPQVPPTVAVAVPVGEKLSLFAPSEQQEVVPQSTPEAVLVRLRRLQTELDRALNARTMAFVAPARDRVLSAPPKIVVKWVDYTNKFGLGYILNDGSIGCILRTIPAAVEPSAVSGPGGGNGAAERRGYLPPSCLLVRGAERHILRRQDPAYADRHQIVPMGAAAAAASEDDNNNNQIDFYENNGEAGLRRVGVDAGRFRVAVDPRTGAAGKLAAGQDVFDHRKRERIVLWKKFANYMLANGRALEGGEAEAAAESEKQQQQQQQQKAQSASSRRGAAAATAVAAPADPAIVTFYQRFGDVGCWLFGDGHLQFNFPDHTKMVLDAGGVWCHFWHLPAEAATRLAATGQLDEAALDARSVLSYPLQTLLNFGEGSGTGAGTASGAGTSAARRTRPVIRPELQGVPAANDLRRKVEFVRSVVREWVARGGLGNSDMSRAGRLRWRGARETVKLVAEGAAPVPIPASKHVWVTIGARQGDVRLAAMVDPRRPGEQQGPDIEERR